MNEDKKVLKFRDEETILFEANDIIQTLLDFLETETFERMFSSIDKSSDKAVFQAGLMFVPSILMAKCNKNYAVPVHKNNQEEEYEPKFVPDPEFGKDYKDWYCGNCGEYIDPEYDFYCSRCGKKIKIPEELKNESNA